MAMKIFIKICWTRLQTAKILASAKQLIRNNSICCLKNQAFFFSQCDRNAFVFVLFLRNSLRPFHDERTF